MSIDIEEFKRRVSMEVVLNYYNRQPDERGVFQCLQPQNHHNGDIHHSAKASKGRVFCNSQKCFGDTGADIFKLVGIMEHLPKFADQKKWIMETFHLSNSTGQQGSGSILRVHEWVDAEGRVSFHIRMSGTPKFLWNGKADGSGIPNLAPCKPDLYQRDQVQIAKTVIVAAGERDCDTVNGWLRDLGKYPAIVATCNHTGESSIKAESFQLLHGKKRVYVVGDNDKTGESYREKIIGFLQGKVDALYSLRVPSQFNDITEWKESSATAEDFNQLLIAAQPVPAEASRDLSVFALTSMSDLLNEPDETTKWLVDQLLPAGGFSVIGGKPKAGKSTTVRNLCLNVARGEPFLGFPTAKGAVIYCAFEEKRGEVKNHFRQLGATEEDEIFSFIGQAPEDFIEKIRPLLTEVKPSLMILDTLAKVARVQDLNDYAQTMRALDPFLHLARQTGAHLVMVHHNGKSDRDGGDNLLGSTAIFAAVDTCLIQKRTEKCRTLQSINRYGTDLEESVLEWNEEEKSIRLGGSKKDSDVARMQMEILNLLQSQDEPILREVIEDGVEGRTGHKRTALKNLVESKAIERQGKGGKGNPFKYSCLLVPPILREQGNNKAKNGQTQHEYRANSCSHDSGLFASPPELAEQAISDSGKEVIDLDS